MRALLVALFAGVVVASASGSTAAFTPKTLAGNWTGTWTNETFGSTGPSFIVIKPAAGNKLLFSADFGGNVFGCADPPKESTKPLAKGAGANKWNDKGFVVQGSSKAFGTLKLTYANGARTLKGGGADPPCAAGLKWTISGKFAAKTFSATVDITLPSGMKATSKISLTRG